MRIPHLSFPFFLALTAHLWSPFPSLRLMAFAPFLALVLMKKDLMPALWISACSGLIVDLTTSGAPFGLYALSYLTTSIIAFRFRRYFFEESFFGLPLFTGFISLIWTLLFLIVSSYSFTLRSLISNLLFMPPLDALYAFFWFTCPLVVYTRVQKKPRNYT